MFRSSLAAFYPLSPEMCSSTAADNSAETVRRKPRRTIVAVYFGCQTGTIRSRRYLTVSHRPFHAVSTSTPSSWSSHRTARNPHLAFNRIVVVRYRMALEGRGLAANTINQQLPAVRRLAYEVADAGLLSPTLLPFAFIIRAAEGDQASQGLTTGTERSSKWTTLRVARVAWRATTMPAIIVSRSSPGRPLRCREAIKSAASVAASSSKGAIR